MKVSRSRSGAVGRALMCSRSVSGRRPFADTVASWFDTGAPGRFVPTYRDWKTSGALFQDTYGTTPVTALEQFVGLNLDRSRKGAVGPELWVAPSVSGGWTANGDGSYTKLAGTGNGNLSIFGLTPGRMYRMLFTIVSQTNANGARSIMGATNIAPWGVVGQNMAYVTAVGGSFGYLNSGGAGDVTVRDISLREVPGVHRIQATPQSRPVLTARKNEYTETEFRNGVADAPSRGGLITAASMTGYLGAIALGYDGATTSYAYKQDAWLPNTPYLQSIDVEALDGAGPPVFGTGTGSGNSPLNDFALVMAGNANGITYTVVPLGGNFYRVLGTMTTGASISINTGGVIKYAANTPRLFRFTAYSRVKGFVAGRYQRVNTATDYDLVGFPVGLRYDGIDDGQTTTTTIDLSTTPYLSIAGAWRPESRVGTQLLIESSPVYSANEGAIEVSLNEINADALVFSRRVGGTVQYRHQGAGQTTPRNASLTGRMNSTLPAPADVDFKVNGILAPSIGGSPNSAPALGNWKWSYGRRELGGLYYAGLEYGDFCIGLARTDEQMAYLDAQFALNFLEALP